jgi:ABC-type taurine transport system ATPase subunit
MHSGVRITLGVAAILAVVVDLLLVASPFWLVDAQKR